MWMHLTTEIQSTTDETDRGTRKSRLTPYYTWRHQDALSVPDTSGRQKFSKDITELKSTVRQLDPIDIYGLLHPKTAEHTLFLSSQTLHQERPHSRP